MFMSHIVAKLVIKIRGYTKSYAFGAMPISRAYWRYIKSYAFGAMPISRAYWRYTNPK